MTLFFVTFSDNLPTVLKIHYHMDIFQHQCPSIGNTCGSSMQNYELKGLPTLWRKFLTDIILCSHVASEPLFMEIFSEMLLKKLINTMFMAEPEAKSQLIH